MKVTHKSYKMEVSSLSYRDRDEYIRQLLEANNIALKGTQEDQEPHELQSLIDNWINTFDENITKEGP